MLSRIKITQSLKKCVLKKYANRFSLVKILSAALTVVFFGIGTIKAQIGGDLYGQQTGDLAGVSSLMSAVSSNDVEGARFFSRAGGFLINQKNIGGATALHIAARNGNIDIVAILLANGADVNVVDNEGWTPLMRAAINGNAKIVDALLLGNGGANVALLNSNHESALIHAALSDCFDCLNIIFTKSDLIKTMDTRLLKEQLIDAFIIARNRESKATQSLLEGYLDRVTKMTPLISNDAFANPLPKAPNETTSNYLPSNMPQEFLAQNGATKYILVDKEGKEGGSEVELQTTMPPALAKSNNSAKEDVILNLVQSPISQQNKVLAAKASTSITNSPNAVITKFKFISGAPAITPAIIAPEAPKSRTIHYKLISAR